MHDVETAALIIPDSASLRFQFSGSTAEYHQSIPASLASCIVSPEFPTLTQNSHYPEFVDGRIKSLYLADPEIGAIITFLKTHAHG